MAGFKEMMKKDPEEEMDTEDMGENEAEMPEEMAPCLYLDSEKYPEVSKLKLGDKVTKEFRVRSRTVSDSDKGQRTSVELELI